MDDFATRMRAAADSPPPSRIDLDALITGELRRRRTLRWASGAAAVAAAVTLAIAVPTLYLPGSGSGGALGPGVGPAPNDSGTSVAGAAPASLCAPLSPSPTGPQPPLQSYDTVWPRPTEPVAQAVPRLTEAARVALRDVLPAGMTVEAVQPGCAAPQFQYHPSYREYSLAARVKDQNGYGYLSIELRPTGIDPAGQEGCLFSNDPRDCTRTQEPDGTIVIAGSMSHRGADAIQHMVFVFRPDGVTVSLDSNNFSNTRDGSSQTLTRPAPPLTIEQLVQIGRTPGLTLYP